MVAVGGEIGDSLLKFPEEVDGIALDDGLHQALTTLDFHPGSDGYKRAHDLWI